MTTGNLTERAMLAHLRCSTWSGEITDRKVGEEVRENHSAGKDSGHYTKVLVARKFRSNIEQARNQAVNAHKLLTLPWYDKGPRALACPAFAAYSEALRLARLAFDAAVAGFVAGYPTEPMAEAEQRLGSMFNADEYPSAEDVRDRFRFKVEISPMAESGDFRQQLGAASIKALKAEFEVQQQDRLKEAMNDVFERVMGVTEKMAAALKNYAPPQGAATSVGKFHDTIVFNIVELAALLPNLNIAGDKRLDELQTRLQELGKHDASSLRADEFLRRKTIDKAQALFERTRDYMN